MIEAKTMVQVEEMSNEGCKNLLQRINYGHFGVSRKSVPYVVPVQTLIFSIIYLSKRGKPNI